VRKCHLASCELRVGDERNFEWAAARLTCRFLFARTATLQKGSGQTFKALSLADSSIAPRAV
jgi:hypothetical protein